MTTRLGIGDFSRMTYLSVKALRHYHDVGVLEPAEVDPSSGYRFYAPSQVGPAQMIRRLVDGRVHAPAPADAQGPVRLRRRAVPARLLRGGGRRGHRVRAGGRTGRAPAEPGARGGRPGDDGRRRAARRA